MIYINSLNEIENLRIQKKSFFVYFSSPNCGVCSVLLPKLVELFEAKFPYIHQFEVDTAKHENINAQYSIFTNPSIIVFINGDEVFRQARIINLALAEETINRVYKYITK